MLAGGVPVTKPAVNRNRAIDLEAGTLIKIEYIDEEWQPYTADCAPSSWSWEAS